MLEGGNPLVAQRHAGAGCGQRCHQLPWSTAVMREGRSVLGRPEPGCFWARIPGPPIPQPGYRTPHDELWRAQGKVGQADAGCAPPVKADPNQADTIAVDRDAV
jgi:hypothetical protein